MAYIGGLQGGAINPNTGGAIRPPVEGGQPVRPGAPGTLPKISDGSVVEGLVTGKEGDAYQVRIGSQLLSARSTLALFVGQRFRAVWDGSTNPPTLKLQQGDLAVLSRFTGRDQQIAMALLSRGMPVNDETIWGLRQQWMQSGADPAKLGVLAELWARGASMTEGNIALLSWYMELSPGMAMLMWKRIRDRLHSKKYGSPKELLDTIRGGEDDDTKKFLQAHALAGRPAKRGLDPALLLCPTWWPLDDDEAQPAMARVSVSKDGLDDRQVWWLAFNMEGEVIGETIGDVMTNGKALSVALRLRTEENVEAVREALPELRTDLAEVPLPLQHLGVGLYVQEERDQTPKRGLDMEV